MPEYREADPVFVLCANIVCANEEEEEEGEGEK